MYATQRSVWLVAATLVLPALLNTARAQNPVGSAFTYQGWVVFNDSTVNDTCDFQFSLWDDEATPPGVEVGDSPQSVPGVTVEGGLFTVTLDFGTAAFTGDARWLEMAVKCPDDLDFITLGPRQELTPAPQAIQATAADTVPWSGVEGPPAQLPQGCTDAQVAKWNGADWACSADESESEWTRVDDNIFYTSGSVGIVPAEPHLPGGDTLVPKSATLPWARYGLACAADPTPGGRIYCFGGHSGTHTDQIVEYDPVTDMCTSVAATLPSARSWLSCAASSATDKIYCFGGSYGTSRFNEIVEFDPAMANVPGPIPVVAAVLPSARSEPACAASHATGKIYCFGGYDGTRLDEIVEYDPDYSYTSGQTISVMNAKLPSARYGLACAADPGTAKIYCFGGLNGGYQDQILEYDPDYSYEPGEPIRVMYGKLPSARYELACTAGPSAEFYCFGGASSGLFNEIVQYYPYTDAPTPMNAVLPSARHGLACAADPGTGKIYCFGGHDGTTYFDQIVEYAPPRLDNRLLQVGEPGDGTWAIANVWHQFSSREYKQDISPLAVGDYQDILAKLKDTDVVRYRYTKDTRRTLHLGVIAEDSPAEILSPSGKAVSLGDYTTFLMAAIKAQQAMIEEKDRQISEVQAAVEVLEARMDKLGSVAGGGAK